VHKNGFEPITVSESPTLVVNPGRQFRSAAMLMKTPSSHQFHIEDRKVSTSGLRATLAAYGAVILFSIAVVTVQVSLHLPNVAMQMGDNVIMASP
jgi:hypothetical protein